MGLPGAMMRVSLQLGKNTKERSLIQPRLAGRIPRMLPGGGGIQMSVKEWVEFIAWKRVYVQIRGILRGYNPFSQALLVQHAWGIGQALGKCGSQE